MRDEKAKPLVDRLKDEVDPDDPAPEMVEPIKKLTQDLKRLALKMPLFEARQLVQTYYALQEERKRAGLRRQKAEDRGQPVLLVQHFEEQFWILERQVQKALDIYSSNDPLGQWLRSHPGIGPVLSAGLLTYFQVEDVYPDDPENTDPATQGGMPRRRNAVGAWWAFAGISNNIVWEKGQKRPYSDKAKVLCYKLGESFVKVKNKPNDHYGKWYEKRKAYEEAKNARGDYAAEAAKYAERMPKSSPTQAHYKEGRLPQHHIHARARRWTVKLFLSHYFEVAYKMKYGVEPPKPYPISVLGHKDYIPPAMPAPTAPPASPPPPPPPAPPASGPSPEKPKKPKKSKKKR